MTTTESVFNSSTSNNNIEFSGLDKELGDNHPAVLLVIGSSLYLNAPEDKDDINTEPTGLSRVHPITKYGHIVSDIVDFFNPADSDPSYHNRIDKVIDSSIKFYYDNKDEKKGENE